MKNLLKIKHFNLIKLILMTFKTRSNFVNINTWLLDLKAKIRLSNHFDGEPRPMVKK